MCGGKILYSPLEVKNLVDTFSSKYVGVHFDVGNVPWGRVMDARREIQFGGYSATEVPPYRFCPEETIWDISIEEEKIIDA